MGGAFKGGGSSAPAVQKVVEAEAPAAKPTAMQEQEGARMRGARRRGRQLLSDARLKAESESETLGSGQYL